MTLLYVPLSPTVQQRLVVSGVRMLRLIMAVREGSRLTVIRQENHNQRDAVKQRILRHLEDIGVLKL